MSNNKNKYFSNDVTEEGNTLIKESSELPVQSLYQILIKNPYLVNSIDDKKETILSYSLKNNNIEVSKLILTSPIIDLDYQDKNENTYLHLAVNSHQKEIIKLLIEKGININKQNKDGNTALHLAYINNDDSIINLLIEKSIDKYIVNKANKMAEELRVKKSKINSNLNTNNKIKVSKNKELSKKIENKSSGEKKMIMNININNSRKKNSTGPNTKRNRRENDLNKINNTTKNNNKSNTSSKSGLKLKVKSNANEDNKKKVNSSNINNHKYDNGIGQTYNDVIVVDDNYKSMNNSNIIYNENNKKYSEFERTIKIDWDIAKKSITKNKENDDDKFFNSHYKEKKNSFGRDQDLCNFEDISFINQKKESNSNIRLKVNKKIFTNSNIMATNTNKTSQKSKKDDKNKSLKCNNKINTNKNTNLGNSINYNPCLSGEYTIRSEKNHSKEPSNDIFGSKTNILKSHNNYNCNNNKNNNESKTNTIENNDYFIDFNDNSNINDKDDINPFHAFSGNFKNQNVMNDMEINMLKNNTKRKSATSRAINKNILISNKMQNKEDNLNVKSSNMESSLVTQSRLKSSHKRNNPLIEFLSQINLLKYLNNLDSNGFDDINLLIEEAKKGDIIKDQELKEAGINTPGDRAKILIRIKEKANLFGFTVPKSVYYTLKNYDNIENDDHIKDLNNWLSNIKVDRYLMNFVSNGYHSIELLLMQMETENPLTTEILRDEIGVDKIGYRSRILNKLKEEGRSLNNKLKTSVLVVNNLGDDKNCECIIF